MPRCYRLTLRIPAILLFGVAGGFAAANDVLVGGRVLGSGRAPVVGAEVRLLPAIDRVARARLASEGRTAEPATERSPTIRAFSASAPPPPGLWTVRVAAAGFVPMEMQLEPLIEPQELDEVRLESDRGIEVVVKGADGAPLPGATARLIEEKPAQAFWWRPPGWRPAPSSAETA